MPWLNQYKRFLSRTKNAKPKERPTPLVSNSAVAASRVTAQVELDQQIAIAVLSNPVVVISQGAEIEEEFGVNSLFEVRSTGSSVLLKVNVTQLTAESGGVFPVNENRGVNIIPHDANVQREDSVGELVFYAGAEEFEGRPGFVTSFVQFSTVDGSPFTDPATGAGKQFTFNPGWSTVLNAQAGQYAGSVALTVNAVV